MMGEKQPGSGKRPKTISRSLGPKALRGRCGKQESLTLKNFERGTEKWANGGTDWWRAVGKDRKILKESLKGGAEVGTQKKAMNIKIQTAVIKKTHAIGRQGATFLIAWWEKRYKPKGEAPSLRVAEGGRRSNGKERRKKDGAS